MLKKIILVSILLSVYIGIIFLFEIQKIIFTKKFWSTVWKEVRKKVKNTLKFWKGIGKEWDMIRTIFRHEAPAFCAIFFLIVTILIIYPIITIITSN